MPRQIFQNGNPPLWKPVGSLSRPNTILTDTFTGADNTPLTSHTPDEITGTGTWNDGGGGSSYWKLSSNTLIAGTNPAGIYAVSINLLFSYPITYKYLTAIKNDVASGSRFMFRKANTGDFLAVHIGYGAGKYTCGLVKFVGGVFNSWLGSVSNITGTFETFVPVKIIDTGTNIKVYFNVSGTEATTLRINVDNSDYNTQTQIGPLAVYNQAPWPKFDTLVVT